MSLITQGSCNCSEGFDINVTTLINTYNTYEFKINYTYQYEEVIVTSSGRGGGRRFDSGNETVVVEPQEETETQEETGEIGETETQGEEFNTEVIEVPLPDSEQEQNNNLITGQVTDVASRRSPYALAGIFLLFLIAGLMFVLRKRN